ncbi:hypothetical protein IE077_003753 [Cardiosporidium cionae]|uniref:Uncharacterized protein n=1 Tax=Cardiosporidium cionae TaxID=476202 RepID=A0ABQ7J7K0_9APIC|nr:hypothetical protein IE077_003753 [Cardiosporidium cionae]|eukprot:KAF8819968.1 hypothetical protein IE077_003753 [Cardiosporidium cionae]
MLQHAPFTCESVSSTKPFCFIKLKPNCSLLKALKNFSHSHGSVLNSPQQCYTTHSQDPTGILSKINPFKDLPWPTTTDKLPTFDAELVVGPFSVDESAQIISEESRAVGKWDAVHALSNYSSSKSRYNVYFEPNVSIAASSSQEIITDLTTHNTQPAYFQPLIFEDKNTTLPREAFPIPPDIFIFNFDGTLNMNTRELACTAALAAKHVWPSLAIPYTNNTEPDSLPFWLLERMKYVRCCIRSNHDLIIALRFFIEAIKGSENLFGVTIDEYIHAHEEHIQKKRRNYAHTHEFLQEMLTTADLKNFTDTKRHCRGSPAFPWLVNRFNFWEKSGFKKFLYDRYEISDMAVLKKAFLMARRKWQALNFENWRTVSLYRSGCSSLSEKQKFHHFGFNVAAVDILNHNLQVFQSPMYIYSTTETEAHIRQFLHSAGVVCNATTTPNLIVYGVDTPLAFSYNPEAKHYSSKNNKDGFDTFNEIDANSSFDAHALQTYNVLHNIMMTTNISGEIIPIHLVNDDIRSLKYISEHPRFKNVRFYFPEWGFSTYADKFEAHISDSQRYKHNLHFVVT